VTTNPFYAFGLGVAVMGLLMAMFSKNKYSATACLIVAVLAGFVGTFHNAP
jgi:hypothetical protein